MQHRFAEELLERGVYRAPYLVGPLPVLFAVDRFGVARKHLKLTPGLSEAAAIDLLERWLDDHDPEPVPGPQLTLIRPSPPSRPTASPLGDPGWPYSGERPTTFARPVARVARPILLRPYG